MIAKVVIISLSDLFFGWGGGSVFSWSLEEPEKDINFIIQTHYKTVIRTMMSQFDDFNFSFYIFKANEKTKVERKVAQEEEQVKKLKER